LGEDPGEVGIEFGVGVEDAFAFAVTVCEGLLAALFDGAVPTQQGLPRNGWMKFYDPIWNALGVDADAKVHRSSTKGKVGVGLELLEALQDCGFGV
jgi:hypothetical protein